MATFRYRLIGDPAFKFKIALERFAGAEIDNIHKQVAVQLTTEAKRNLEQGIQRPWESGSRPQHRLTGVLTGKHGHKSAIVAHITNRGGVQQAKGVGFPDLTELDRRAKHWRGLEYGWPYMTMPTGLFIQGGQAQPLRARTAGDTFIMYGEHLRNTGLRTRSSLATSKGSQRARGRRLNVRSDGNRARTVRRAQRVEGIAGRHFLEDAWNFVVGPNGRAIVKRYEAAIREAFPDFRG